MTLYNIINEFGLSEFSRVGPAVARFNNRLHLAWTGTDNRLNIMSSTSPNLGIFQFRNKRTSTQTSTVGPALAVLGNRLFLAWTGTDNRLNFMWSSDGISFGNRQTLPHTSTASPALAVYDNVLYLVWTGTDDNRLWAFDIARVSQLRGGCGAGQGVVV
jgi:hypothetical protein